MTQWAVDALRLEIIPQLCNVRIASDPTEDKMAPDDSGVVFFV